METQWTTPSYTTMSWKEFNAWRPIHPAIPPHLAAYVPFDAEEAKRAIYGIAGANRPGGIPDWEKLNRGHKSAKRRHTKLSVKDNLADLSLDLSDLIGDFT